MSDNTKNLYIKIFEKCLIVEKWLQREDGYDIRKFDTFRRNIQLFMREYKATCNRRVGNNMKLVKFHMLLHIVDDIDRLGSPQNTNGGPCEANFKPQKKESVRTQRRARLFHEQMARRIYEQQVISRATLSYGREENIHVTDRLVSGARFSLQYNDEDMQYEVIWSRPASKSRMYKEELIEFVYDVFFHHEEEEQIQCFTEHKVNGYIFRGDCSYRGEMEWYDWANILWDNVDEENESVAVLGRIHMFVDCRKKTFPETKHVNGIDIVGGEIYAIISSLTWNKPRKIGVSTLFYKGQMETHNSKKIYYVIPASSLDSTAIAISNVVGENNSENEDDVIVVTPCDEWKYKFEDMYEHNQ